MNWTARNKIAGSHVLYSSVPYPVYKKEDIIPSIINLFKKEAKIPKEDLASDINKTHPVGPINDDGEQHDQAECKSSSCREKIHYSRP